MKKRLLAMLLMVILILTVVGTTVLAGDDFYNGLEGFVEGYNDNLDKVPSLAKRMFANERVNFHIQISDGEEIIGVVTDADCAILEFAEGGVENPTIRAYIEGAVIEDLKSDFSVSRALEALKGIRLEGVGFGKIIKVFFLNIAKSLAGLFG